jgi:hypothetical protein
VSLKPVAVAGTGLESGYATRVRKGFGRQNPLKRERVASIRSRE